MYLPEAITEDFKVVPVNPLAEYLAKAAVGLEGVESPTRDDEDVTDLPDDVPTE
ncbi:hypothetical protein [Mycolicibacter algericus]|uniref:hypothetical protein n=1 Tax=Mycolicibacter algericus TaxID=1288388 RepID=UPI003C7169D6